jgi:hypothetical protein
VHSEEGTSAQVQLEIEATVTEGLMIAVERPDDYD